jgi:hypothetical protein
MLRLHLAILHVDGRGLGPTCPRQALTYGELPGIILVVYALVLSFVPAPGIPAGSNAFNHNLVHFVDIAVLGPEILGHLAVSGRGWGTI